MFHQPEQVAGLPLGSAPLGHTAALLVPFLRSSKDKTSGDCFPHPSTLQSGILSPRSFLLCFRSTPALQGPVELTLPVPAVPSFLSSEIRVRKEPWLPLEGLLQILV